MDKAAKAFLLVCPAQDRKRLKLARSFRTVCKFLSRFPDALSAKAKGKGLENPTALEKVAARFYKDHVRTVFPKDSTLAPDPVVREVLRHVYGYNRVRCNSVIRHHSQAMAAENCIGALLERYIASKLNRSRWVWCAGNFVKSIDFVCYVPSSKSWRALQVKNRDNSENSASKSVRAGTDIKHWYRCSSRDGATNWAELRQLTGVQTLTEGGFRRFVAAALLKNKKSRRSERRAG